MPAAQVIDVNPNPRTELTPLEKTLSSFAQAYTKQREEKKESDALREIYAKYKDDEGLIQNKIEEITSDPRISPTARVNTVKSLLQAQDYNLKKQQIVEKQAKEVAEKELKKKNNQAILTDLEQRRDLQPGELAAYEDNPAMAASVTKPERAPKEAQANQPIAPDQLQRIQHVRKDPEFEKASPPKKYQMLTDAGVSSSNSKTESEFYVAENKPAQIRTEALAQAQAKEDIAFVSDQVQKIAQIQKQLENIDAAAALNAEGVTGNNWDLAMQKSGLLQYTSDGHRLFSSYAKEAVKNSNIKGVIGSQISQMEFGFFRDATISERFSKEANEKIIEKERLALRYDKLYADITENLIKDNNGEIPERIQAKVNEEFAKQSQKISRELKQAANDYHAIQNVPDGYVLMFDKKRRPIHVPEDQVALATQKGASLK